MATRRRRAPADPTTAALVVLGDKVAALRKASGNGRTPFPASLQQEALRALGEAQRAGMGIGKAMALAGLHRSVVAKWPGFAEAVVVRTRRRRGDAALAMRPVETNGTGPAAPGPLTLTTPTGYQLSVGTVAELVELLRALGGA